MTYLEKLYIWASTLFSIGVGISSQDVGDFLITLSIFIFLFIFYNSINWSSIRDWLSEV